MKFPAISALMYQVPADKANHALWGLALFIVLAFAVNPFLSVLIVISAGVVKELYDKVTSSGTPDYLDAVATGMGGVAGFICTRI